MRTRFNFAPLVSAHPAGPPALASETWETTDPNIREFETCTSSRREWRIAQGRGPREQVFVRGVEGETLGKGPKRKSRSP